MNIFYLNNDPKLCAEMHLDKHVVKMILEYAQLLSTAHRVLDGTVSTRLSKSGRKQQYYPLADERDNFLYSATHVNHPSAVWVRYSDKNYTWLICLLKELCKEYTHRYGKIHKCERDGLVKALIQLPKNIPIKNFTEPTPAMPDEVKVLREVETDRYEIDSIKSYHKYYIHNKVHIAKWTKREMPLWYSEGIKSAYLQLSKQRNK
jgi:hypothetical protein